LGPRNFCNEDVVGPEDENRLVAKRPRCVKNRRAVAVRAVLVEIGDMSAAREFAYFFDGVGIGGLAVGAQLFDKSRVGPEWSCINDFPPDTTMVMSVIPEVTSSRTVCSITGLSPTGNISFGMAFVNGSSREPRPAAGITALRIVVGIVSSFSIVRLWCL
jgi:hypothetical protein